MNPSRRHAIVEALLALGGLWIGLVLLAPCLAGFRSFPPADLLLGVVPSDDPEMQSDALRFVATPHLYDAGFLVVECSHLVREAFRAGDLPFRNPSFRFGMPLLGNGQSAAFSPFMVPVWLLPWPQAFAWSALLKLAFLWGGAWLYARTTGLRRFAALFLCTGTMLLPGFLGFFQHPNANALCAMPMQFAALEGLANARRSSSRVAWTALLTGATAVQLLGGHYQSSFCVAVALAVYAVVRIPRRPVSDSLAVGGLAAFSQIAGLAIAAPAVLPFVEAVRGSFTMQSRLDQQVGWSVLGPDALRTLLDPFAFGDYRFPTEYPWKGRLPWPSMQQYVGLLSLCLAPVGIASVVRKDSRARTALAWIAVGAVGASLAFGWWPIHDAALQSMLFRANRNERFAVFLQWALVALGAIGLDGWISRDRTDAIRSSFAGGIAVVCAGGLAAASAWAAVFEQWSPRPFMAGGAALLLVGGFRAVPRRWHRAMLAAPAVFLALDAGGAWARYFPCPPAEWFRSALRTPAPIATLSASPERRLIAAEPFPDNVLSLHGVAELRAYDFPVDAGHAAFVQHVLEIEIAASERLGPDAFGSLRAPRILRRTGASGAIVHAKAAPFLDCDVFGDNEALGDSWVLAHFKEPEPFAAWTQRSAVRELGVEADALSFVREGIAADREEIVVRTEFGNDSRRTLAPFPPVVCRAESLDSGNAYRIAVPDEARGRDGWVVVRASWDNAWRAFDQDGNELELAPAQIKFFAVRTRGGASEIVLRYRPRTFTAALWCCGFGVAALLAMGAGALVQSRRERSATTMARRLSGGGVSVSVAIS